MAGRWRIRHKLILGLGLVIGVLALLLLGTLKGLASYRTTTTSMDSKLLELREAQNLKAAMIDLAFPTSKANLSDEIAHLQIKLAEARKALSIYEEKLQFTLDHRRDSDKGLEEMVWIKALEGCFTDLELLLRTIDASEERVENSGLGSLRQHPRFDEISKLINDLLQASNGLQEVIYRDLQYRITTAKVAYRNSMWIVGTTSIVGVALMIGLLRFFYGWMYYPIRDLERGVGRVAQGDFDHHIEVDSGDEIEDLAKAYNDMTGRLRDLYGDLTHQVNERSRQLVRSERLASVGFLAAGVAHEINNPLASIAFCAEALEARLQEVLDFLKQLAEGKRKNLQAESEVVTKYLRMIQEEAFRCKKITEKLLEFSRPGDKHREPTDLGEIVQSVINLLQHHQSCRGKQILLKPSARIMAAVNEQEIKSVVLNLVVNALDSMNDGGTLTIRLRQRDGLAEMEFTDTGCGMTAEVLENIFEPFFTRSNTGKGTGLGLTISHRIISQHSGEIAATSPGPGAGSTFTVRLPLQPGEVNTMEEPLGQAA